MEKALTVAMSESDRTQKIMSGQETLGDLRLEPQKASVEEIFVKQISEAVYDVAELSLASYLIALGRGEQRLTAIPVFLSRSFRHNAIYVRSDSPWTHPSQLKNRKFGFPEYQMTAAVWVRGFFRHEWGIANDEMSWFTYRDERVPIETPAQRGTGDDIFKALADGEVDAVMTARRPPASYFPDTGEGGVLRRLFPDVWEEERSYYRKTGIFPIMHLVSLKEETVRQHPELPGQLYQLMLNRKNEGIAQMLETIKNQTSAPWIWESVEQSAKLMDSDIWPYGLKANWSQIQLFMSYLQEDGLLQQTLAPEQVFHPSVLHT
ncbi:4,5-dihydroxyphthalate decarboxylase [Paenibacillus lemnae]|uniref:4,5-dihydroxyphthalate decarboxylase n=1 Tax=Paenibacillus lemnae TaxID=1330551 RepID=A0A848MA92_PAELE|nr:4,5-dihydroxyphthalate decarboxylase [Paenibacillus lemnae]NMO96394.1 4,5-dihydroxyphthalate decarboxylase [Paenibacillus lemnae]